MSDVLRLLLRRGVLDELDTHLALSLTEMVSEPTDPVRLGVAFASRAVRHGHVCADLGLLLQRPLLDADDRVVEAETLPALADWIDALHRSALVGDGSGITPLVLDGGNRLYLRRYWNYQRLVALDLRRRAALRFDDVDPALLREGLRRLFPDAPDAVNLQRVAAIAAVERALTVVSGGPGTGKTTTVVRILALLQEQMLGRGMPSLRVTLLAPTGKAAARLSEAIRTGKPQLACEQAVRDTIPDTAATIHRVLGARRATPTRFRHNARRPLPTDVVVVDEASMVDLALMAKLVDAVPPSARLILLGDRDQLASVEAGAILGDICGAGEAGLPGDSPMADTVIHLAHSYRFHDQSAIGRLARAVNGGDEEATLECLRRTDGAAAADGQAVKLHALPDDARLGELLRPAVLSAFRPLAESSDPRARLEALDRFRILCAHRRGPFGVVAVNALVEGLLAAENLIDPGNAYYPGRPILVTTNDYQLGLYNGDIGVIARDEKDRTRAWFVRGQGELVAFLPARLPPHETVFAMTVHKSQGSEMDAVALLLPRRISPILTRELVYTGISRARRRVDIYGSEAVLRDAIDRRIERASGLREALWGGRIV